MTRSGSLAYYLAAVVCGSFFFTLAHFLIGTDRGSDPDWARAFLFSFFLGTIFMCIPQIFAGFVLRRLAGPLHWTKAWHWAIGGAGIFLLVLIVLGYLGGAFDRVAAGTRIASLGPFVFGQASMRSGIWQTLSAGALTALVLFSVQRAFGGKETAQQNSV
jgi:hypothetical protein